MRLGMLLRLRTWINVLGLNNRFNVVLARVSGALAFTVKLLKKKKKRGAMAFIKYGIN